MFDNANVKSQKMLSPVAILGTGLHRQWLPPSCAGNKAPFASLENWELLLRELAETEGVAEVISPALLSEAPTLQWEELIRAGVTRNNNRKAAAEIEKRYRKRVVQLLRNAQSQALHLVDTAMLNALNDVLGRHTVSLNMDTLIIDLLKDGRFVTVSDSQDERVYQRKNGVLWFPHGSIRRAESVKLGLRDYGRLPSQWEIAIGKFKKFERDIVGHRKRLRSVLHLEGRMSLINPPNITTINSLVSHLMCAPLIIYGSAMRQSEWGIWWMLNQRARNMARVPSGRRPETRIILNAKAKNLAFWMSRPANIQPIIVPNWCAGWSEFIEWMYRHKNEAD